MKTATKNLVKVCRVGDCPSAGGSIYVKAEVSEGKMSITGVIGPKSNGNARGSCGQIAMGFARRNPADNDDRYSKPTTPDEITFADGWSADLWLDFLDTWDKWHLNDMKANCEHQEGPEWDAGRKIVLYYFRLSPEVVKAIREAKDRAKSCIKSGETFTPTAEETRLANLPDDITSDKPDAPSPEYVPNGPQYTGDHYNKASETKSAGWVHQSEHPLGILSKPCSVCGYKYGSAWRNRDLPDSVVEFIAALPDADVNPAWV